MGAAAQVTALYLITGPHANALGLYYLPVPYLCHDTGMDRDQALRALAALDQAGFASYDADSSFVWIPEMAAWQYGEWLSPRDKRVTGIRRTLARMPQNPFAVRFTERYRQVFHLDPLAATTAGSSS
ncbi:MAG: helix-turn-helix domain-containing protein [Nitrospirota bacterium]|nr:helix-turn-helix domain-containing protein [Nitrospirota bacterium]